MRCRTVCDGAGVSSRPSGPSDLPYRSGAVWDKGADAGSKAKADDGEDL